MRVTDQSTLWSSWQQLQLHLQQQDHLQQQLSSGKRILSESDDPLAAAEVQDLRRQLGYLQLYKDNAARADTLLKFTDGTLNSAEDALLQAIQIGTQGASQLVQPSDRTNLANTLRSIKTQLVALGNSTYQGQYLFAGSATLSAPFTVDSNTGAVTFNGNTQDRSVPVSDGVEVQVALSGQSVFLTKTNLFAALDSMANAVEQGDTTTAASQLQEVEKGRAAISQARSRLGRQMQVAEGAQAQLDKTREVLMGRISNLEDADISQIVSQLSLHQTAMQALLYSQGSIGRKSLFDFIA